MQPTERALALAPNLFGGRRSVALQLDIWKLRTEDGVDHVLRTLDDTHMEDSVDKKRRDIAASLCLSALASTAIDSCPGRATPLRRVAIGVCFRPTDRGSRVVGREKEIGPKGRVASTGKSG